MTAPVPIPDGVYWSLRDDAYHADFALGATDLKRLADNPEDWWWGSNRNPDREDTDTPSRKFGRAMHKCVLEGSCAFMDNYAPTENPGNTKAGKEERAAILDSGRIPLSDDDYCRILAGHDAIQDNPHLASSFTNGRPEVSVFWTDAESGVRLKCRQDYVKARATVDLKTIRPTRPGLFPASCKRAIGEWRYHGQAAHYLDGRAAMHRLIADGAMHGDCDPDWIKRLQPDAAFVFVFLQAEGAPLTWGTILSPDNDVLMNGRDRIRRGLAAYRDYSERFGEGAPWITHEKLEELSIDDLPNWALI